MSKNLKITLIVAACALVLVLIPIIAVVVKNSQEPENVANTGETLSGTYSMNPSVGLHSSSSGYTFDGDKATSTYFDGEETVTKEYTYVIAIENGEKVIKFTHTDEDGKDTVTTHGFYTGTMSGKEFISINESYYYKQ